MSWFLPLPYVGLHLRYVIAMHFESLVRIQIQRNHVSSFLMLDNMLNHNNFSVGAYLHSAYIVE